ncbi:alpha/beta fold hydrolase [Streptomyces sp. SPB074]|uniref:bifunctional 3-oxoadipate enol-lactonase/4-carboxymuconolactone decarboxylase PcaDC n=1 Tax=Streptomyces sp. (strain SPB074) TaxID=465543 RepID=UPI0005661243|nr:alpha/beta fold hydrolase [Streptomyces sp. SPB074]
MSEISPNPLQYRLDGPEHAPVLVLGPALGTTWHMWDRQVPELSRQWRVLRFDLPGHGGAAAYPADSVGTLTDRLVHTLESAGISHFGYAGCAFGGAIGIDLALRHPQRLASLALVATAPRFGTADEHRQRGVVVRTNGLDPVARTSPERWFTPGFAAAQPAITDWAVQMVRTTDPGCYIAACEALATFDTSTALDRVATPTLVVVGAEDALAGPAQARTLVAGISDARLALVPGAAHLAPVEQPSAVTDLLVRHFSTSWSPQAALPVAAVPAAAPPPAAPHPAIAPYRGDADTATGEDADTRAAGLRLRREVLGDAHVDTALAATDAFTEDFEDLLTRYAWGEVWQRPGLDRRHRSCVALGALAAAGHFDQFAVHVRGALRGGLTPAEIKEALLQIGVHCGLATAERAFQIAREVVREETSPRE